MLCPNIYTVGPASCEVTSYQLRSRTPGDAGFQGVPASAKGLMLFEGGRAGRGGEGEREEGKKSQLNFSSNAPDLFHSHVDSPRT